MYMPFINFEELNEIAEALSEQYIEQYDNVDVNLHREVQKLSKEWWMDFIIGIYLASCI